MNAIVKPAPRFWSTFFSILAVLRHIWVMKAVSGQEKLNRVQADVMGYYASGESCAEIGSRIGLSEYAVSMIVLAAADALGAKNPAHAVAILSGAASDDNNK